MAADLHEVGCAQQYLLQNGIIDCSVFLPEDDHPAEEDINGLSHLPHILVLYPQPEKLLAHELIRKLATAQHCLQQSSYLTFHEL